MRFFVSSTTTFVRPVLGSRCISQGLLFWLVKWGLRISSGTFKLVYGSVYGTDVDSSEIAGPASLSNPTSKLLQESPSQSPSQTRVRALEAPARFSCSLSLRRANTDPPWRLIDGTVLLCGLGHCLEGLRHCLHWLLSEFPGPQKYAK